jgi:hypothetical protein
MHHYSNCQGEYKLSPCTIRVTAIFTGQSAVTHRSLMALNLLKAYSLCDEHMPDMSKNQYDENNKVIVCCQTNSYH